jgi:hypothetical protein
VKCFSAGENTVKFMSKFLRTLSSRSVFQVGVIQKYTLLWSIPHHAVPHCSQIVTENKWLMELITAAYSWQITSKLPCMNTLLALKHNAVKWSTSELLPFVPNITGHQACWFISRILMRLSASDASVIVKHRAVNQSRKLKTQYHDTKFMVTGSSLESW